MELNWEVLKDAYDFTISIDGEVYGLVAGDQGWEKTGIKIDIEDLIAWAEDWNYKQEKDR